MNRKIYRLGCGKSSPRNLSDRLVNRAINMLQKHVLSVRGKPGGTRSSLGETQRRIMIIAREYESYDISHTADLQPSYQIRRRLVAPRVYSAYCVGIRSYLIYTSIIYFTVSNKLSLMIALIARTWIGDENF